MPPISRPIFPLARNFCSALRKIPLASVKALRARSGAPVGAVKDALVACDGDVDLAHERLRRDGARVASLRAGREANDGLVGLLRTGRKAALVQVLCETDFVARTERFQETLARVAVSAIDGRAGDDGFVDEASSVLGERIRAGEVKVIEGGFVGGYVHGAVPLHGGVGGIVGSSGGLQVGRIGVAVALSGESAGNIASDEITRRLGMHIAAESPRFLSKEAVPQEVLENEMDILMDAARAEGETSGANGKPDDILRKIVKGRLGKFLNEVVLQEQEMLGGEVAGGKGKLPSVAKWLASAGGGVTIEAFERFAIS